MIPFRMPHLRRRTSVAASYSKYRIGITAVGGSTSDLVSCERIQMRSTVGGADFTLPGAITPGTLIQSSNYGAYVSDPYFIANEVQYGAMNTGGDLLRLGWQFTTPQDIVKVLLTSGLAEASRMARNFTVEYGDTAGVWSVAATFAGETGWTNPAETRAFTFASVGAHLYWSVNVTLGNGGGYLRIGVLRFLNAANNVVLTRSGRPGFVLTNSEYGGGYYAVNAFTADTSLYASSAAPSVSAPIYIGIDMITPRPIAEFTWKVEPHATIGPARAPKDFFIQGWNGFAWVTLKNWTGQIFTSGQERAFTI